MKLFINLLFLLIITSIQIYAQSNDNTELFNELSLNEKKEKIIQELLSDTIKFSKEDVYYTGVGLQNRVPYSQLYIINRKQYFRFDVVEQDCVKEFIDSYLNNSKLKLINRLSKNHSTTLYGASGENGVTVITIKNLKKAKTENCTFLEF